MEKNKREYYKKKGNEKKKSKVITPHLNSHIDFFFLSISFELEFVEKFFLLNNNNNNLINNIINN